MIDDLPSNENSAIVRNEFSVAAAHDNSESHQRQAEVCGYCPVIAGKNILLR